VLNHAGHRKKADGFCFLGSKAVDAFGPRPLKTSLPPSSEELVYPKALCTFPEQASHPASFQEH